MARRSMVLYPAFEKVYSLDSTLPSTIQHILAFPFTIKGKRLTDLLAVASGSTDEQGSVVLLENPRNRDVAKP